MPEERNRCDVRKNMTSRFIESICDDETVILNNIKEFKISSPDYTDIDEEEAIKDFKNRIYQYEKGYETLDKTEIDGKISFVKLSNVGNVVLVNHARGYLQSRIVYFLYVFCER